MTREDYDLLEKYLREGQLEPAVTCSAASEAVVFAIDYMKELVAAGFAPAAGRVLAGDIATDLHVNENKLTADKMSRLQERASASWEDILCFFRDADGRRLESIAAGLYWVAQGFTVPETFYN